MAYLLPCVGEKHLLSMNYIIGVHNNTHLVDMRRLLKGFYCVL